MLAGRIYGMKLQIILKASQGINREVRKITNAARQVGGGFVCLLRK